MNRIIKFRAWDKKGKMMLDNVSTGTVSIWGDNNYRALSEDCEFMQFTGLKDKNGKEIYEGDILKVEWKDERYSVHNIGPVKWEEENAAWSLGEGGGPKHDAKYYFEVIGNVYENKDLVK